MNFAKYYLPQLLQLTNGWYKYNFSKVSPIVILCGEYMSWLAFEKFDLPQPSPLTEG